MKKDTTIWLLIMVLMLGFTLGWMAGVTKYINDDAHSRKRTNWLIFGQDTFVVKGAHAIDYKLAKDHWLHGYCDSATGIVCREFQQPAIDTQMYSPK